MLHQVLKKNYFKKYPIYNMTLILPCCKNSTIFISNKNALFL